MTVQQTLSQYAIDALLAIGPLIVALVGFLVARATAWVAAHTKNALVLGVTSRLGAAVSTAVAAMEQTAVAALKARSGGVLSLADAADVKAQELAMITASLGGQKWLAKAEQILGVDDIRAEIGTLIEAEVLRLTGGSNASKSAPVAATAVAR